MTKKLTILLLALAALGCSPRSADPVDYVNPFIGTGFHGHTYPGATTPFGMVQLSPDTRAGNWDACAGYHYSDTTIDGFSHTHLSGTGCADLADILFHPTTREIVIHDGECVLQPYFFSHDDERASCGYYAVTLPDVNIGVELTAAPRTGVHRYTFAGKGPRRVIVDLLHTVTEEKIDLCELRRTAPYELAGMRRTQGWVPDQYVFFAARFSEPFADVQLLGDKQAVLTFAPDVRTLTIAVGLSSVSVENARMNSLAEVPELDFDAVHARAVGQWRKALGDIVVEGGSRDEMTNFYTAQYHTKLTPNLMNDVNGEYRRHDQTVARMPEGKSYYSTFSLWDTFRAWNPLQTLVDTALVNDMIRSMLDMYDSTGELPIWPLASGETGTMIGYHAVSVIADAYLKGIRGYDADKALEAMIRSSNINKKGSDYLAQGYIPSNIKRESVSCTLEYAYDDWAIARMAQAMGRDDVFGEYARRALNYVNVFDGSICFFRGRQSDGNWSAPFEEFATGRDYTEATPWHYRFFVPHDVNGLIQLFGSRETFIREMDRLFTLESDEMQLDVSDVTGLMGQYAHGNEPSHHMAYLYNYVGQPWKTQELTRRLLHEMYAPTPEGIIGNEDCGQMSAWYVFSSLGFYPVCPGSNEFALTAPQFPKAVVRLANGRTLTVTADNPRRSVYIASVTLDGKPIDRNYITYDELMQGGELHFALRPRPDYERGTDDAAAPHSLTRGEVVSIPYTTQNVSLFTEPLAVALATTTSGAEIRYTLDGSEPTETSALYAAPVPVDRSLTLKAKGFKPGAAPSRTLTLEAEEAVFRRGMPAETATRPGVAYSYYEGVFSCVNDIRKGKYVSSGTMPAPSIAQAPQEDHFAYVFTGLILIPERGVWEFMTKSDDGSVLMIGDRRVVDNDGSHASVMATGRVALEAGLHPYTLLYFEDYEGQDLAWGWKAPGAEGFEAIPEANLRMTDFRGISFD